MKTRFFLFVCIFQICHLTAQQSFEITFDHDGKTVNGTFATPAGDGPFPTIIINPGSGPNDRDGTFLVFGGNTNCLYPDLILQTLKPYKELSDALVDSGYAVLRYDKLEYTYPTSLGTITFHKLWLPVESAIDYVKTRADVDTTNIILIGHSEGSTLIPYIANGRNNIRALISVAGARTPFDSILAYQLVNIANTCGGDTVVAQNQAGQILDYFHIIRTNTWNASTPSLFGVPASAWYDYVQATDPVADNYNADNLPTLFLGLGLDINVPPPELERFRHDVTITDDFWSIPGLIHYMTPPDDPHVSEALTDTIIYWLREHGITTSVADHPGNNVGIDVYPNPCTTEVHVRALDLTPSVLTLTLWNGAGQLVLDRGNCLFDTDYVETLDLRSLPPGLYTLEVSSEDSQKTISLIKQ